MPPNPPHGLDAPSGSSSYQLSTVEPSKRRIKRDSSQFNNFKEGKHCDTWHRNTLATTRAKHAENVLDPNCTPLTQEEVNLFNEKHNFMHYVFSTTLKTDRGKKFVRDHEDNFDTQIVYKKSYGFYATSAGDRVSASDILSYITSA